MAPRLLFIHSPGLSYLIFNGQLREEAAFALPLPNRGLFYNDGFFETLIWTDGGVRLLAYHLNRVQAAAAALQLTLPIELSTLEGLGGIFKQVVATQGLKAARLRLQLWRAGAGLYTPATVAADYLITAVAYEPTAPTGARADFSQQVHTHLSPLSFCKGPHALTYVLAARERAARGLDEIILLDSAGHVAEAGAAAIFWFKNGCLYTPTLSTGCVAGVRRTHLLRTAQLQGLPTEEGLYLAEELLTAEAVFTANVASLRSIRQIGETTFAAEPYPLYTKLQLWEADYRVS
ncbi:aminotransferase class IV [Hymenobacter roseosalivarius DSM 11622]|uniref:branched-chain-amino-acid transaminase n=1 Tax=Hymenobacter roseosalivarius DSM 11622 TaxID=645990 RepID=A0A1W1W0H9_9BACT|nr:aminotransferase class IV [Hymenobacter roseosalivarius]SMB99129.1 aminotransferase class IV [Hymenobacter roseosalivarius DSM 11622]